MATHSSVLAWRIPGTGEPGGLPSMGLHRVRHNWSDLAAVLNYVKDIDTETHIFLQSFNGFFILSNEMTLFALWVPFDVALSFSKSFLGWFGILSFYHFCMKDKDKQYWCSVITTPLDSKTNFHLWYEASSFTPQGLRHGMVSICKSSPLC